ncbi:Eae protein [Salmonella enterica subsp. enterica serovar Hull]|nr:ead/Ea22-like family protein [Salmonella enterica subsp. enterica serovar Hull]EBU8383367.1 Eae protein [Salmonella enterica subsp. enterica serovar Hull]EBW5988285.1 ead/Ea22-like family protein [Salmonella enterica subsp. enterica serovar Hull]EBY7472169.1 ead/Ea22-like family protein [Salmonella enterica subsp. enterica serovar Hull]ECD1027909.1 ead/Ea22-like family protein [Salmonella enterica subsp. enterica serovar Hull]
MKEVKIYTIVSDQLSPPITGESFCTDMVRHSDYADLEEKCAALAAENAGLKKSEVEFNEYCRHECEDVGDTWVDDFTETPATDAFLAEVRAQSSDELAELYFTLAAHEANRYIADSWRESARFAKDHAAQLRKGVQS